MYFLEYLLHSPNQFRLKSEWKGIETLQKERFSVLKHSAF